MKKYYEVEELDEFVNQIEDVLAQIANLRLCFEEQLKNGICPQAEVVESVVDIIREVNIATDIQTAELGTRIDVEIQPEKITMDDCNKIETWLKIMENWLMNVQDNYCWCNLCGKRVIYQPAPTYFREEQKKNKFPYSHAIFESLSRTKRTCPSCQAMDRERMLALFIDMLKAENGEKLKVLQIAPSVALDNWLKQREDIDYETTDLMMEEVTFQSDIQDMHMVEDETYDIVICSHILEHVSDDRKAMKELKRVLKEEGVCLFLVPLVIGLDKTDEELGLSAEENWNRFGRDDHVRLYSKETFLERLTESGYQVHVLERNYFGEDMWKSAGLSDIHCMYAATKKDIGIGILPINGIKKVQEDELVSVIIPTYNRGYCIENAIQSVLNQTWKNIEVLVVDDGSKDNTESVVANIKDDRIHYLKLEQNMGANYARNLGIKEARGKYIAFNDSDDEWLPEKLEKQMKHFRELGEEYAVVYCTVTKYENGNVVEIAPDINNSDERIIGDVYEYMLQKMFISTQTLLVRKSVLEEVGGFNEEIGRLQDWELLLRIAKKYKFSLVQESLVRAYVQKDCISKKTDAYIDTMLQVINWHEVARINPIIYMRMIGATVGVIKAEKASADYIRKLIIQLEKDQIFSRNEIKKLETMLNRDCLKREELVKQGEKSVELKEVQELLDARIEEISVKIEENNRMLNEILWAQVFNSSRKAFKWLDDDFACWPGRWAVGYQYMYVVSRYLNEVKPQKILETGLGQSTRLIGSYVKHMSRYKECEHLVLEHDKDWIEIFKNDFEIADCTQIVQRDLDIVDYVGKTGKKESTYVYRNSAEVLASRKFDFISIDGPYGTSEEGGYSRIDIVNHLPECLAKSFCIIVDDYERWGEKNTVTCIKAILKNGGIDYAEAVYKGNQDMYILVSTDLKFLCTL